MERQVCDRLRYSQGVTFEESSMNPSDVPADARPLIAESPRAQGMLGTGLSSAMWPDYLAGQPDKPVRVLVPAPAGSSVTSAGILATVQCQKPEPVGASGS